jgi:hypothetical protein
MYSVVLRTPSSGPCRWPIFLRPWRHFTTASNSRRLAKGTNLRLYVRCLTNSIYSYIVSRNLDLKDCCATCSGLIQSSISGMSKNLQAKHHPLHLALCTCTIKLEDARTSSRVFLPTSYTGNILTMKPDTKQLVHSWNGTTS